MESRDSCQSLGIQLSKEILNFAVTHYWLEPMQGQQQ